MAWVYDVNGESSHTTASALIMKITETKPKNEMAGPTFTITPMVLTQIQPIDDDDREC